MPDISQSRIRGDRADQQCGRPFFVAIFCDVELRGGHWPVAAGSMAELVLRPDWRPQVVDFDC